MARSPKTRFALLGLLAWQPMSGYQVKKLIDMALSHFWSESYGQLYPTLNQLVREGLATRRDEAGGGRRRRHVYRISAKGRRELADWLKAPSEPPRVRMEHQLKFFLGARRPTAASIAVIEEYRTQQSERLELYRDSERMLRHAVSEGVLPEELAEVLHAPVDKAGADQELMFLLTLRHGILAVEARLAWCDEALETLRRAGSRRAAVRSG